MKLLVRLKGKTTLRQMFFSHKLLDVDVQLIEANFFSLPNLQTEGVFF